LSRSFGSGQNDRRDRFSVKLNLLQNSKTAIPLSSPMNR
jgi:hypothetical protein